MVPGVTEQTTEEEPTWCPKQTKPHAATIQQKHTRQRNKGSACCHEADKQKHLRQRDKENTSGNETNTERQEESNKKQHAKSKHQETSSRKQATMNRKRCPGGGVVSISHLIRLSVLLFVFPIMYIHFPVDAGKLWTSSIHMRPTCLHE